MTSTNSSYLKHYKFLTENELNRLNTKRLLALLRTLHKPITNLTKYGPHGLHDPNKKDVEIYLPKFKKYKKIIKQILSTRENVK